MQLKPVLQFQNRLVLCENEGLRQRELRPRVFYDSQFLVKNCNKAAASFKVVVSQRSRPARPKSRWLTGRSRRAGPSSGRRT
jgi:transposase